MSENQGDRWSITDEWSIADEPKHECSMVQYTPIMYMNVRGRDNSIPSEVSRGTVVASRDGQCRLMRNEAMQSSNMVLCVVCCVLGVVCGVLCVAMCVVYRVVSCVVALLLCVRMRDEEEELWGGASRRRRGRRKRKSMRRKFMCPCSNC